MGANLEISGHARRRMASRSISDEEVLLTVNNPDFTRPGDYGATNRYRSLHSRLIRVTVGQGLEGAQRVVITVALRVR
jgi:hypothetical protein